MYRMYEAVMHYGEAIKAIMNEELGALRNVALTCGPHPMSTSSEHCYQGLHVPSCHLKAIGDALRLNTSHGTGCSNSVMLLRARRRRYHERHRYVLYDEAHRGQIRRETCVPDAQRQVSPAR